MYICDLFGKTNDLHQQWRLNELETPLQSFQDLHRYYCLSNHFLRDRGDNQIRQRDHNRSVCKVFMILQSYFLKTLLQLRSIIDLLKITLPQFYVDILNYWNDFKMYDNETIEQKILKECL